MQRHSQDLFLVFLFDISTASTFPNCWLSLSEYKKKNQYSNDKGCRSNWCNNCHRKFLLRRFSTWIRETKPWVSFNTTI